MTVVNEPPYLHKSAGVAPRNGTTSHTITFSTDGDAPFTPATGSLLALFIFGGVTNTNAGGWTEVEQPVSSGELSLFTIASAPTLSVTIGHNASNFPACWCVYEFPSGASATNSTSNNAGADTFPALTGNPTGAGNERVVLAARGRVAASSETAFSTVWTGPFVKDTDQFIATSPTDGASLTCGHQINSTSASVTPVSTPTYTGTWGTTDREKIVAAFDVPLIVVSTLPRKPTLVRQAVGRASIW